MNVGLKVADRESALAWFRDARFGMFLHYGLYALIGKGEWHMHHAQIAPADYAKWKDRFTAERFDADVITDLALAAGMRYVNLTTRHHDGFCLFETAQHDFHSVNSPARRDLVGEMAEACRRKGLGFFLYYSYGLDWRDPNCNVNEPDRMARYVEFMRAQLRELLTNYGPVAGIWFDLVSTTYAHHDVFQIESSYSLIRDLQPQALIAYKQGATGTEDFAACEFEVKSLAGFSAVKNLGHDAVARAAEVWNRNHTKPREICTTLQHGAWGYNESGGERHNANSVLTMLANAAWENGNLLLNSGPLPDGSIHPDEIKTLRNVGQRLDRDGWPAPAPRTRSPETAPACDQGELAQ